MNFGDITLALGTFAWVTSNLLVAYIAFVVIIFVVGYYILFDPRATTAGKNIFRFFVSLLGVVGLIFIGIFVDPQPGRSWWTFPGDVLWWRPLVRLVAYSYVAYTVTALAALLIQRKWFPHRLRTAPDKFLVRVRSEETDITKEK